MSGRSALSFGARTRGGRIVVKKLIVASLAFELLALASVAFLVFTAPRQSVLATQPRLSHSMRADVASTRERLEAAQVGILWDVMAMIGISMAAQVAYLVVARRASASGDPRAKEPA